MSAYDVHDEKRIPLQPEALTPRESGFFRLMAALGLREKNIRDEKVARAAADNLPLRLAEAERTVRQPGVSPEAVQKAARMLARAGRGAK